MCASLRLLKSSFGFDLLKSHHWEVMTWLVFLALAVEIPVETFDPCGPVGPEMSRRGEEASEESLLFVQRQWSTIRHLLPLSSAWLFVNSQRENRSL